MNANGNDDIFWVIRVGKAIVMRETLDVVRENTNRRDFLDCGNAADVRDWKVKQPITLEIYALTDMRLPDGIPYSILN
jgi:hypothetical protein